MKAFVVGASTGLGRALSLELAMAGHDLHLLASNQEALSALENELTQRFGARVSHQAVDLAQADPQEIRARVLNTLGSPDAVFLVAGTCADEDQGAVPPEILDRILAVNFLAPVKLANAFLPDLAAKAQSWLVGVGSIAQSRARRANCLYGAGKSGLEFYFQGLRHYFANGPCRVQFYRAGYMKTKMTQGKKLLLPAAEPQMVARAILRRLSGPSGVSYLPGWWAPVMLIFKLIPWALYKKINM